jgi:hypothetical protein
LKKDLTAIGVVQRLDGRRRNKQTLAVEWRRKERMVRDGRERRAGGQKEGEQRGGEQREGEQREGGQREGEQREGEQRGGEQREGGQREGEGRRGEHKEMKRPEDIAHQ